jgi:hypothetical protein
MLASIPTIDNKHATTMLLIGLRKVANRRECVEIQQIAEKKASLIRPV